VTGTAPRRLSREEQKAQTRAKLIAAARKVFARRGYHAARLEEIAAEAGYTQGAIYASFEGKEALFLAVFDEHVSDRLRASEDALATARTPAERVRAGADEWMAFLRADPDWYPLFIEFWAYAVRRPELREKAAARFAAYPRASARQVEEVAREHGIELPGGAAERLGTAVVALADGLALMKLINPDSVPDELFGDVLAVLLAAGQAGAAGP
jgi:AcrR family transcriptional regulator